MKPIHLSFALLLGLALAGPPLQAASPAFEAVRKVAESVGTPSAQFILGQMYEHGQGTPANPGRALHYYQLAARQGYAKAQYRLGLAYLEGLPGLRPDPRAGREWLAKAAAQGHVEAQYRLALALHQVGQHREAMQWLLTAAASGHREAQYLAARHYLDGQGTRRDPAEARRWLEEAAGRGHVAAARELAGLELATDPPRPDQALRWYRWAAEQGDREAAFALARLYDGGAGLPPDPDAAIRWYRTAAEGGDARACAPLGRLLAQAGRPREARPWLQRAALQGDLDATRRLLALLQEEDGPAAARPWLERLAEAGDPAAQRRLGLLLRRGAPGMEAEPGRAAWWLTQAAEQGDGEAAYVLGRLYLEGLGVARNGRLARRWLEQALRAGVDKPALWTALGRMRLYGQGGPADPPGGFALLERAAAAGDAQAAFLLAESHADGIGTETDQAEAERWYRRAAELGHAGARERLGLSALEE